MAADIIDRLFERIKNPVTKSTYASKYRTLVELAGKGKDWEYVLKSPKKMHARLKESYDQPATIANYVTAVMAAYKGAEDLQCKHRKAYSEWKAIHASYKAQERERYMQNEPTEAQKTNYVPLAEIEKKVETMASDPEFDLSKVDQKTHMQFLLLNVILHINPKRADLGHVHIVKKQSLEKSMDDAKENYIVFRKNSCTLVLNAFKTSATYTQIVEQLHDTFKKILEKSLEALPRGFLFVDSKGDPYVKTNSYVQFVRRAFIDMFGKAAGVSLARHAFINERVDFNRMSLSERDQIARSMGHSLSTQELYKWKSYDVKK